MCNTAAAQGVRIPALKTRFGEFNSSDLDVHIAPKLYVSATLVSWFPR